MTWKTSLCTATAPWASLKETAVCCADAGMDGFDLAVKPHVYNPRAPAAFWTNNAAILDQDRLPDLLPWVKTILRDSGLACRVLSGYTLPSDVNAARELAAAAVDLECSLVRIWTPAPRPGHVREQIDQARRDWRHLSGIAAEYGIRFLLEIHHHTIATGPSGALRLLEDLDPENVGVIYDIGNSVIEGNEPLALGVEMLGSYLAHVHVKDLRMVPGDRWDGHQDCSTPLGEGAIQWQTCLRILQNAGYEGWLGMENFTGIERDLERIQADAEWLQCRMSELGS